MGYLAAELHEAQRDGQLTDEHHRPGPEIGRPGGAEAEVEELEGAGQYRDVTDAGREAAERPDAAGQRLLISEVLHAAVGCRGNLVLSHYPAILPVGEVPGQHRTAVSGDSGPTRRLLIAGSIDAVIAAE